MCREVYTRTRRAAVCSGQGMKTINHPSRRRSHKRWVLLARKKHSAEVKSKEEGVHVTRRKACAVQSNPCPNIQWVQTEKGFPCREGAAPGDLWRRVETPWVLLLAGRGCGAETHKCHHHFAWGAGTSPQALGDMCYVGPPRMALLLPRASSVSHRAAALGGLGPGSLTPPPHNDQGHTHGPDRPSQADSIQDRLSCRTERGLFHWGS